MLKALDDDKTVDQLKRQKMRRAGVGTFTSASSVDSGQYVHTVAKDSYHTYYMIPCPTCHAFAARGAVS